MVTWKRRIASLFLVLIALMAFAAPVLAQDEDPPPPTQEPEGEGVTVVVEEAASEEAPPDDEPVGVDYSLEGVAAFIFFLCSFFPLVGGSVGSLISTLVNGAKAFGLIKDNWAALAFTLLNVIALAGLYFFFGVTPADALPAELDEQIKLLVTILTAGLTLTGQLGLGRLFHEKVMKPISPWFSHSRRKTETWRGKEAPSHTPV